MPRHLRADHSCKPAPFGTSLGLSGDPAGSDFEKLAPFLLARLFLSSVHKKIKAVTAGGWAGGGDDEYGLKKQNCSFKYYICRIILEVDGY